MVSLFWIRERKEKAWDLKTPLAGMTPDSCLGDFYSAISDGDTQLFLYIPDFFGRVVICITGREGLGLEMTSCR